MQEGQTDGDFALSGHAGGGGAGFLVDLDLAVQFLHIFQTLFLAHELNNGGQHRVGGAGRAGIGHRNLTLQLGPQQILPGLGNGNVLFLQQFGVGGEAEIADVDAGPESFGILEFRRDLGGVGRLVFIQQAFLFGGDKGVRRTAPPDAGLRVVFLGADPAQDFAGTHADGFNFDAGVFLEFLHRFGHMFFQQAAIQGQLQLFGFGFGGSAAAAAGQGQRQDKYEQDHQAGTVQTFFTHDSDHPPIFCFGFSIVAAVVAVSRKKPGRRRIASRASREDRCFSARQMQSKNV